VGSVICSPLLLYRGEKLFLLESIYRHIPVCAIPSIRLDNPEVYRDRNPDNLAQNISICIQFFYRSK
jgi:hypothetical protein